VTRIVYQDIDEFAEALRGTVGCFIRTARSPLHWSIEGIDLTSSSMQHLQTGGPFTFAGKGQAGHLTFHVPLTNEGTVRVNGHILDADSFVVLREERPFVWSGSHAGQWAAIAVPLDHTLATSISSSDAHHTAVRRRTSKTLLDGVRHLIDRALFKEDSTDISESSRRTVKTQIDAALTHALEHSVPAGPLQRIGRPQLSRPKVIATALDLMSVNQGQPLFIDDLCRATQVSERALRNIFQEFFGVGPMRLLKVRQLHEIRAALLGTRPGVDTVTAIAARFGVFDPSLLARNYKALFAESPSQTLYKVPMDSSETIRMSWLRYASRIFLDVNLHSP
jgi:AraC family transcriptional regulator, ethanolamine operon transcriptional activator